MFFILSSMCCIMWVRLLLTAGRLSPSMIALSSSKICAVDPISQILEQVHRLVYISQVCLSECRRRVSVQNVAQWLERSARNRDVDQASWVRIPLNILERDILINLLNNNNFNLIYIAHINLVTRT